MCIVYKRLVKMAEGESVKVAVRVRPFNSREKQMNAKLCIRMEGLQMQQFAQLLFPKDKFI